MNIPYKQSCYDNAVKEVRLRSPYMYTKYGESAKRTAGQIRGIVVEQHASDYMQRTYPNNYLNPDNFQIWHQYCNHDFKIVVNGETYLIDVSGPKVDGTYGSYAMKPSGCNFHIIVGVNGMQSWDNIDYNQGFEVLGVVSGANYVVNLNITTLEPFEVWIKRIGL
jgi:hypothetical protein